MRLLRIDVLKSNHACVKSKTKQCRNHYAGSDLYSVVLKVAPKQASVNNHIGGFSEHWTYYAHAPPAAAGYECRRRRSGARRLRACWHTPTAGQQAGAAAPAGTKTKVRVGSWDRKDAEPIEADVIAAFNKEYPDIEVVMEFNPDAYDDKLLTAMAGGTAPDVFLWWNFPGLVARNGIQDLTELVQGPNGVDPAIYFKEVLDYNRVGDGLYGLPKDFTPRAYYFNKKLFDDAGVAYPAADWTTNDLLEMAKALTKGEDGPDKQYGFFTFSDLYALQGYVWQHAGDFISPDGAKATGYADSDATTSVLDWHAAMNLKEGVAPTAQAVSSQQGGADQLFISGKLAMYDTGRWPQAQFKKVQDLQFGTCLPPVDADTGKRVTVLHEAGWSHEPCHDHEGRRHLGRLEATWPVPKPTRSARRPAGLCPPCLASSPNSRWRTIRSRRPGLKPFRSPRSLPASCATPTGTRPAASSRTASIPSSWARQAPRRP